MKKITLIAFLLVSSLGIAQDMKVIKGDYKFLNGAKELNVEFNYSDLKLMKDNLTNEEYVSKRASELNEKTKGNGDVWKKKWATSREAIWGPKFLELMNKVYGSEKDVTIQENLKRIVAIANQINPNLKMIFTISPVRHITDGFVENQLSKAHLIAAL